MLEQCFLQHFSRSKAATLHSGKLQTFFGFSAARFGDFGFGDFDFDFDFRDRRSLERPRIGDLSASRLDNRSSERPRPDAAATSVGVSTG